MVHARSWAEQLLQRSLGSLKSKGEQGWQQGQQGSRLKGYRDTVTEQEEQSRSGDSQEIGEPTGMCQV